MGGCLEVKKEREKKMRWKMGIGNKGMEKRGEK